MKFLVDIIALVCIIRGCASLKVSSGGAGLVEWLAWRLHGNCAHALR